MYYIFGRSAKPGRWIEGPQGDVEGVDWTDWRIGERLAASPPSPLRFTLRRLNPHASDHGPHLPAFLNAACPLFKRDLIAELVRCGVDNLDTYDVVISDPDSATPNLDYRAVNIIGMIRAADMARSEAIVHPGGPALVDVGFDRLVIDPSRTGTSKLFRLAESTKTIVVHETVRDHLVARGFDDLAFYRPNNVAI
jgi:hypothetical protein